MRTSLMALAVAAVTGIGASAQAQEAGTPYFLPKTAVHITVKIEKSTYTPGDFAAYAPRFLKLNPATEKQVGYRILGVRISPYAVPDTSRKFYLKAGEKRGISNLALDDNGVLLAVNAQPVAQKADADKFIPARKPRKVNPRDYLSQEILAAGSSMKMAELTAQDIYDIRDSRNQLSRGQADFMPKDGEQLKLMLQKLDLQESVMLQLFTGTTDKDTTEVTVDFVPAKETGKQLLFRFSKRLGLVDKDDLGGAPYYVSVDDEHSLPDPPVVEEKKKKEPVMYTCLPGKIKMTLYDGAQTWKSYELYAAQFGQLSPLDEDLFNKKVTTTVVLNPYTGGIVKINTVQSK